MGGQPVQGAGTWSEHSPAATAWRQSQAAALGQYGHRICIAATRGRRRATRTRKADERAGPAWLVASMLTAAVVARAGESLGVLLHDALQSSWSPWSRGAEQQGLGLWSADGGQERALAQTAGASHDLNVGIGIRIDLAGLAGLAGRRAVVAVGHATAMRGLYDARCARRLERVRLHGHGIASWAGCGAAASACRKASRGVDPA